MFGVTESLAVRLPVGNETVRRSCGGLEVLHMLQERGSQQWRHHDLLLFAVFCIVKPTDKYVDLLACPRVAYVLA